MFKRTLFMLVSLIVLLPFVYINAEETLTSTDVSTIGQKRSFILEEKVELLSNQLNQITLAKEDLKSAETDLSRKNYETAVSSVDALSFILIKTTFADRLAVVNQDLVAFEEEQKRMEEEKAAQIAAAKAEEERLAAQQASENNQTTTSSNSSAGSNSSKRESSSGSGSSAPGNGGSSSKGSDNSINTNDDTNSGKNSSTPKKVNEHGEELTHVEQNELGGENHYWGWDWDD